MNKLLSSLLLSSLPLVGAACIDQVDSSDPTVIGTDGAEPGLEGGLSALDPAPTARRSLVRAPDGSLVDMEVTVRNGRVLIEGDIDVGPEASIADPDKGTPRGNVLAVAGDLWPTTTIPYDDSDLDATLKTNVQTAISRWQSATPFRFVKRTNESDYLEFVQGSGCSSAVGRTGWGQNITLESGVCSAGNIMHEMGHALGLYHEQMRTDRDDYVTHYPDNVEFGKGYANFSLDGTKAGSFDFNSMMLYDSFAFTDNNAPTLLQKGTWSARRSGKAAWANIRTNEPEPMREAKFGDFTGDGKTDALKFVGNDVFVASGVTGPWTKVSSIGYGSMNVGVGSFDGDPRTDLFRADGTGWYYSSAGTGPWTKINSSAYTLTSLRLGDFNADGRTDVMRPDGTYWNVSWGGKTTWQLLNTSGYSYDNIVVGNFDTEPGDDILLTTGTEWKVSSRGSLPAVTVNWSSVRAASMIVGNFDGAGTDDIVYPGAIGRYDISNDARSAWATFANSGGMVRGGTPPTGWMRVVDYDSDGIDDILMPGAFAVQRNALSAGDVAAINSLYFGTWQISRGGSSTFEYLNQSNYGMSQLRVGDFNHDGRADLFRADGSKWWVSYSGTGSWTYLNSSAYQVGELGFGDFNCDGDTDVFRTDGSKWWVSYSGKTVWYQRNISGYQLSSLKFGDLNGDKCTDVFLATGSSWFVSYGGYQPFVKLVDSSVSNIALVDVTGDGRDDVFYATGTQLQYSDHGTPGWHALVATTYPLSSLAFGDFDGDGKDDVFRSDGTYWYISKGGATTWQVLNTSGYTIPSLRFGDFDADKRTDIVTQFARLAK